MTTFNLARSTSPSAGPSRNEAYGGVLMRKVVNFSGIIQANSGTTSIATTDLIRAFAIPPNSVMLFCGAHVQETAVSGAFTISAASILYASGHMSVSGDVDNKFPLSTSGTIFTSASAVDVYLTLTSGSAIAGKVVVYAYVIPPFGAAGT